MTEDQKKPENIFQTTVGYDSLLKILTDIIDRERIDIQVNSQDELDHKKLYDDFDAVLSRASNLEVANTSRYSFNNRGKKFLYLDLSLAIWPADNKNDPRVIELTKLESD